MLLTHHKRSPLTSYLVLVCGFILKTFISWFVANRKSHIFGFKLQTLVILAPTWVWKRGSVEAWNLTTWLYIANTGELSAPSWA